MVDAKKTNSSAEIRSLADRAIANLDGPRKYFLGGSSAPLVDAVEQLATALKIAADRLEYLEKRG